MSKAGHLGGHAGLTKAGSRMVLLTALPASLRPTLGWSQAGHLRHPAGLTPGQGRLAMPQADLHWWLAGLP